MKEDRGEISIMMIVVVIVLIIFGAICIFMLTGENGLFIPKRLEQNKENTNQNIEQVENEQKDIINEGEKANQTENGELTIPMQ